MQNLTRAVIATFVITIFGTAATAQNVCPCVPLTPLWTAKSCDTYDCVRSALVIANGDPMTFAFPTGADDHPWIVVQRIMSGSGVKPADANFDIDAFDGLTAASAMYFTLPVDGKPMLMTAPDGKVLLISRREATALRRRSTPH